ncbi:MAG: DUF2269 family protein [Tannerella sp.]|jgi:hypothetical protein|nr:DUF2269 family protein [Tannerella sp.]
MKKMKGRSYKALKFGHLLFAGIWTGAAVTALFLLTVAWNGENVKETLLTVHRLDLLVIIPANLLTLISGILFSVYAGWGFVRHGWVTLKYIINLIPVLSGGIVIAPSLLKMLSIAEELGNAALHDSEFVHSLLTLRISFSVLLMLLVTAVYLSVFKPGRKIS